MHFNVRLFGQIVAHVCVCFVILFPPSVFADGVATTEIHVGHKKNRLNTSLQMAMAKAPLNACVVSVCFGQLEQKILKYFLCSVIAALFFRFCCPISM